MQLHFSQFVVEKGWKQASYVLWHKITFHAGKKKQNKTNSNQ